MRGRWSEKSTAEVLVLMIAFTVCFSVIASGTFIAAVAFFHPSTDISVLATKTSGIINTMVGLLAGFLAGRTTANAKKKSDDEGDEQ